MGKTYSKRVGAKEFVEGGEVKGRNHRFQSGNAVFRRAEPDNPWTANHQINMVTDYSNQRAVIPKPGFVKGLQIKNHSPQATSYGTMNASGKSAAALPNITVGSGTDDKGVT